MCELFHPWTITKIQKHFFKLNDYKCIRKKMMRLHQEDCAQGACFMYSAH